MEYFPLILRNRLKLSCHDSADTIEEVINKLKNSDLEISNDPHIFCHGDYLDDKCLYEVCLNPKLREIGKWIMNRIILEPIEMRTVGVRLRIATGVLNKTHLKTGGDNLKIQLQYNFVHNVQSVFQQKFAYDLPF